MIATFLQERVNQYILHNLGKESFWSLCRTVLPAVSDLHNVPRFSPSEGVPSLSPLCGTKEFRMNKVFKTPSTFKDLPRVYGPTAPLRETSRQTSQV